MRWGAEEVNNDPQEDQLLQPLIVQKRGQTDADDQGAFQQRDSCLSAWTTLQEEGHQHQKLIDLNCRAKPLGPFASETAQDKLQLELLGQMIYSSAFEIILDLYLNPG